MTFTSVNITSVQFGKHPKIFMITDAFRKGLMDGMARLPHSNTYSMFTDWYDAYNIGYASVDPIPMSMMTLEDTATAGFDDAINVFKNLGVKVRAASPIQQ